MYVGYYWNGSEWKMFYSAKTHKAVEIMFVQRFGKDYRENQSAFKIEKEKK
jgi:hypothetical protein